MDKNTTDFEVKRIGKNEDELLLECFPTDVTLAMEICQLLNGLKTEPNNRLKNGPQLELNGKWVPARIE